MENIKNTASLVSSSLVVSTQMPMIKAAGDAPLSVTMKMIKNLGQQLTPNGKRKSHYAIYECPSCGQPFRTRVSAIKSGQIKACRCRVVKKFIERNTKHGLHKHPLYHIYSVMKQRCLNPNNKAYPEWGGRGIVICEEWENNFIAFYKWAINNGFNHGLVLDREDNDGNYSPENCRWINDFISKQNTRLINKKNTSGYRGLYFIKTGKRIKRWVAEITYNGKKYRLGYHLTPEQAAQAYNDFVIKNGTSHPLNIMRWIRGAQ